MKQKEFNLKFAETIRSNQIDEELVALIKDSPKIKAHRALEVYQEDYQARMTEALRNTYRAINALIGDEDFFYLAKDYIENYPSPFSDLDEYGNCFSEFLTAHQLNEDYVFLSELAHFEWNFREVFHQAHEIGLEATLLAQLLQEDSCKIQLVHSVRVLHYSFLIDKLYALKDETDHNDEDFDFNQNQYLLIYKDGVMVKIHSLSKAQWKIVNTLEAPHSLLSVLQNADSITPSEVQELFQILGANRLLIKKN